MRKTLAFIAAAGLLAMISSGADARGPGGGGGPGASGFAPGHMTPVAGSPGASGNAPGHLMQRHGRVRGASAYAPGHRFKHR